jgi:DNA-binding transcriptional LysR family regulator
MDRLETMRVFVVVADRGSFAEAGRRLELDPVQVTRAVASLEERLGQRLFHRTTRHIRLTEAGARYLDDCRRILRELDDAESALVEGAEPRGLVQLTAPVMFGRLHIQPLVLAYLEAHPEVRARVLFTDQIVGLVEEEVDVALRIDEMPDSALICQPVGQVRRILCASPAYLRHRGLPQSLDDLREHSLIATSAVTVTREWVFYADGKPRSMRIDPRLVVNSNEAAVDAALAGFGLARLLSYQVAAPLREGRLETVLAELEPPPLPVQIVYDDARRRTPRVRSLVDFLVPRLRHSLLSPNSGHS